MMSNEMHTQLVEALLAAAVYKLADGELKLDSDDLLEIEGKTFQLNDVPDGFLLTVSDDD